MTGVPFTFLRSLAWVALFIAVATVGSFVVEIIIVDFVHGNPYRTQSNAWAMLASFPPLLAVFAMIYAVLIFALAQALQAFAVRAAMKLFRPREVLVLLLLLLPVTTLFTWFSFDYLTAHDTNLGFQEGADWMPYQHGLTATRYSLALLVQAPVSLFCGLYWWFVDRVKSKRLLLLSALAVALAAGCAMGYRGALNQFQFLSMDHNGSEASTLGLATDHAVGPTT
jgi:hypothetical protein